MSRARQLDLQLSVDASVVLQQACDQWKSSAEDQRARAQALETENAALRSKLAAVTKDLAGTRRSIQQQRQEYRALVAMRLADAAHPLYHENVELRRQVADLRAELRTQFEAFLRRRQEPAPALEPVLKQLLTLAHPDKWSAGQAASELAHELTVLINHVRSHGETLP